MKKNLLLAILFTTFLLAIFVSPVSANNSSIEIDKVNRTIHLNYNKMIIVTDDYIYHNIGNDPITSILVQVPYKYLSNLGSFLVYGDDGKHLTADRPPYDGSGFIKWRIYLNIPL
ncbi:MAG: hypothetical protein ACTSQQ_17785, partial [Candidatus Helarchaeota archaeon]